MVMQQMEQSKEEELGKPMAMTMAMGNDAPGDSSDMKLEQKVDSGGDSEQKKEKHEEHEKHHEGNDTNLFMIQVAPQLLEKRIFTNSA